MCNDERMRSGRIGECEVCGNRGWVKDKAPTLCPDHLDQRQREERAAAWASLRAELERPFVRILEWLAPRVDRLPPSVKRALERFAWPPWRRS